MSATSRLLSQVEALAQMLDGIPWAITITHDSGDDLPAAFNIYVKTTDDRLGLRAGLCLRTPDYEDEDGFEEHRAGAMTICIIEEDS